MSAVAAAVSRWAITSHGFSRSDSAFSAALGYFDMMRTRRSTANLLQANRDFFGAHGFERVDRPGAFHGPWGSHAPQPATANGNQRH